MGLDRCVKDFLSNPIFSTINWKLEAFNDLAAHEFTPLKEINGNREKCKYLYHRFGLSKLKS